jgi:N-acetylglucosamine repressor
MNNLSGQLKNHEKSKSSNTAFIYQLIDLNGPISRVNLVQHSALAPASVTNITRQLMEHSLISEVAQQASTGGRPAISLTTNLDQLYFVSCRLGRVELHSSVINLQGGILFHHVTDIQQHDQNSIIELLNQQIQSCLDQAKQQQIIAIAVTLAGLIDAYSGEVHYSPNHDIGGLNLIDVLTHFAYPVFVGNDNRALALTEYYLGSAQQCDDFILVTIHGGVGAGVVSDGHLLSGKHRSVGEIGHVQIDPFGKQCHCGNFGCLETEVSNQSIVDHAEQLIARGHPSSLLPPLSIDSICLAAENGDPVATHVIKQAGEHLGQVLSMLVNVFNPEKILLAGEIVQSASVLFPVIQEQIQRKTLNKFNKEMYLETARFQQQGTMGGYALVKRAMHNGELLNWLMGDKE